MDTKTAKEFMHIHTWLGGVRRIVESGKEAYLQDEVSQWAGDALLMWIGEAARRLESMKIAPPQGITWRQAIGNRNFLIHQYDSTNRNMTWETLSVYALAWEDALQDYFDQARAVLETGKE